MCQFIPITPELGEVARASYPSKEFIFSDINKAELLAAWTVLEITPAVTRSREQMFAQRERSLPIRWFDV